MYTKPRDDETSPLYQRVKNHIVRQVNEGQLRRGARLPSEADLVAELGVSRMTVNRALRELSAAGVVERVQGLGTFVKSPTHSSELMELKDIVDDIALRGTQHVQEIKALRSVRADAEESAYLDIPRGTKLYNSVIIHKEDGVPIQIENRLVLPAFAPSYLENDFDELAAGKYLRAIATPTMVEHTVFATTADDETSRALECQPGAPCLILIRRTWIDTAPVTLSKFTYPGEIYSLVSRRNFTPT